MKRYVNSCDVCQRIKTPRHKVSGPLQSLPVPNRPWSSISMDFDVKLPLSHGFDSVLVVVDRFTQMAHFITSNEAMDSRKLATMFLDNIFKVPGLPDAIVSDLGPLFVSTY